MWGGFGDMIQMFWRWRRRGQSENENGIIPTQTGGYFTMSTDPTNEQVADFLRTHPEFLERFIMEEVDLEQLERWIIRRSQRAKKKFEQSNNNATNNSNAMRNVRKTSLSRWKFCVHADKRQMLLDLTQSLQIRPTKDHVLWELANCISSAVGADGFRLYLPERGNAETLALYLGNEIRDENGEPKLQRLKPGITVPDYVARTREPVRLCKNHVDARFPDGIPDSDDIEHVLCQAIVQPDGQLAAILELWRRDPNRPFHEEDEEIGCSYLVWGGIALHYAHLYLSMNKQRKLNDFLLDVVKSIFQDMVSMDTLVIKIMNFAQRLVNADRASLFLVDSKQKELYATIFDVGVDNDNERSNNTKSSTSSGEDDNSTPQKKKNTTREIRFPLGTGIAGQVALTGEILNIDDAYADPRFNRTIDQLTGYKTETILCMPIFIRGSIIGVVQMVNKHSGLFTKEDEDAFEMFAVYCGLALHHAKLYDKIRRSEQKYRVALEVLSYHNTCSEEELQDALQQDVPDSYIGVDDYYFNPFDIDDYAKAKHAIFMFTDLFGLQRFEKSNLIRFVLTVRKNYRRVPYHNWTHGFSVANCMYSIIKHSRNSFRPNEALALFIGGLCHDLDHRGKNNKFMLDTESPLAAIYSTSTMEHHHFNQTVTILQQEGHNIFSKLSSVEYKQVLGLVKHCILATDLALFFPNRAKLLQLVSERKFSWSNIEHRTLLLAISMTSSDLSASAKPWDIQVQTVKVIFEEFYQQGDAERAAGRQPISMMDRQQPHQQASSQVGFLNGICIPCYTLMYQLIPETKPLLEMCQENLRRWQQIDKQVREQQQKYPQIE
ncbi:probable 3',5'-cyclic phosphodiesterase pde-5 [Chrysoperla carnea]|uniref:probable 3',5'-cyclic phosphodiesterase pde-5 n=1 Tax=Chrysoperla carnea TaxID=189513 RepID=UPI001D05E505|nr:probable 3',5'-cyclic phosphodiesterase pde-5 [Chrysoperla carnea]